MSYTGKKRYTSRREKFEKTKRNTKIIMLFLSLATLIILFKNRFLVWGWLMSVIS